MSTKKNREAWLLRAVRELDKRIIKPAGFSTPEQVWVSVGWPKGRRGGTGRVIGQCWPRTSSADKAGHVFISPELSEANRVLDVLLHELGHDIVGCEHGHKSPFSKFAKAVGLVKPWTATTASPELQEKLNEISTALGPYPHAALTGIGIKKQTTRMRLYECPGCQQKVRAAKDELSIRCNDCVEDFVQITSTK